MYCCRMPAAAATMAGCVRVDTRRCEHIKWPEPVGWRCKIVSLGLRGWCCDVVLQSRTVTYSVRLDERS